MNRSKIFTEAHQTAKVTRNNFYTYRQAFSAALKAAYAPKVEFHHFHDKNILPALEAIAKGGKWNGTIYGKKVRKGKETVLSVYVDGKQYSLATTYTEYVGEAKAEFMAAVKSKAVKSTKQNNSTIFGASSEGENDVNYRPSALYHAEMSI